MICCHCRVDKPLVDFSRSQLECKLCNQRRYNAKRKPTTRRYARHKKWSAWTTSQIELLREHYHKLSISDLTKLVDKSYASINSKAKELQLRPLWQGRD